MCQAPLCRLVDLGGLDFSKGFLVGLLKDQFGGPALSSTTPWHFFAPGAVGSRGKKMVEAVGIEPTSEELRSLVSPCAAGD